MIRHRSSLLSQQENSSSDVSADAADDENKSSTESPQKVKTDDCKNKSLSTCLCKCVAESNLFVNATDHSSQKHLFIQSDFDTSHAKVVTQKKQI